MSKKVEFPIYSLHVGIKFRIVLRVINSSSLLKVRENIFLECTK